MYEKIDIRFDLTTAHEKLQFSNNYTSISYLRRYKPQLQDPFDLHQSGKYKGSCVYVDGSKQFSQGEHMWCVDVVDAIYFTIGVATLGNPFNEDVGTNKTSWCLKYNDANQYHVMHNNEISQLPIQHLERITICLDMENKLVHFLNSANDVVLACFNLGGAKIVKPVFGVWYKGSLHIK